METKHTKGKWHYKPNSLTGVDEGYYILSSETWLSGSWVSTVNSASLINGSESEVLANAKLIAAAPELLETMQHIVEYWNRDRNDGAMYDALYNIIDAAENAIKIATE